MHAWVKEARQKEGDCGKGVVLEGAPFVQGTARYSMRLEWQGDREGDPR